MRKKVLLLEFNELCPRLLDQWIGKGKLPNFERFYKASDAYVTEADAEPPALEPWIQWYSVHTGLSYEQHKVFRLTDGPRAGHVDIWQVLREAGLTTANCSSMNAKGYAGAGSFCLPDPWCTTERAYPEDLNVFHRFIVDQVQGHTNPGRRVGADSLGRFLAFLVTHGIRLRTISDICRQLLDEKLIDGTKSWRRVALLDWIQQDVFFHYYKKFKPDFATFFLNSTAHFQHAYWRFMEPEHFDAVPDATRARSYRDAILFGYRNMDRLLGKFFELEEEGVTIVLATALSQQPFTKHEPEGGQRFYRPRNIRGLLSELGIYPALLEPVMAHQYMLRFDTEEQQQLACRILSGVHCEGQQVFDVDKHDNGVLFFGNQLRADVPKIAQVRLGVTVNDTRQFYDLFYLIDATKSGCHHPDGVLWIKSGRGQVHARKVSVLDIFPTLLDLMGITYPPSEHHPYRGRSLVAEWNQTGLGAKVAL